MINIEPIDFPGIEAITNNLDFYKNKFINDSVIVFRNANLSPEDQKVFHKSLGDAFGWFTFEEDGEMSRYFEDHSTNTKIDTATKDEIMLGWHIEHVYYENPIVASTWNMLVFNTDNDNGKTYFVDSEKVYSRMPESWKNFLNKCTISAADFKLENVFPNFKPVQKHWITNNDVLRLRVSEKRDSINNLVLFDDKEPTEEEKEKFRDIVSWFSNEVINNEEIRMVHRWQKGDLVFPDMFKLAHAVTGGFSPLDRKFIGIWGNRYVGK
jgi:alpha-ketoglutarate-dependent taurine dioxygenase